MKKKLALLFCLTLCLTGLFSSPVNVFAQQNVSGLSDENKEGLRYSLEKFITTWISSSFEQMDAQSENETAIKEQYGNWKQIQLSMGSFNKIGDTVFIEKGSDYEVKTTVEFENGSVAFTITYDPVKNEIVGVPTVIFTDKSEPLGTRMRVAGINTIMAITIVFLVLIFISFVIWLFKFIPAPGKKKEAEIDAAKNMLVRQNAALPEERFDDKELTAVVTAAIMASMSENAPAGGFVVRSIRKKDSNH